MLVGYIRYHMLGKIFVTFCPICIQQTRGDTYYAILRNNLRLLFAGFLIASWRLLDLFLALLDDSWRSFTSFWQLFSPPESSSLLKIHQEATETPSRSRRRHEFFWNKKKSWSFPIYQELSRINKRCQEVVQEVSKKLLRSAKTWSSARFLFNFVKVRQLVDGQPEFHQIIITN